MLTYKLHERSALIMKKPDTNLSEQNENKGNKLKEFWANKETRWTLIAFAVILLVTIIELVVHFVK